MTESAEKAAYKIKAIEIACDSVKQIITLSSGILTALIAIVFSSSTIRKSDIADLLAPYAFCYFISIVFGLASMFAIAGIVETGLHLRADRPLLTKHYRNFSILQTFFFTIASFFAFVSILRILIL